MTKIYRFYILSVILLNYYGVCYGGYICSNCMEPAFQNDADGSIDSMAVCIEGEVCATRYVEGTKFSFCTAYKNADGSLANPVCECSGSFQRCDGYNSTYVMTCGQNGPIKSAPCSGGIECNQNTDTCLTITTTTAATTLTPAPPIFDCTGKDEGFYLVPTEDCKSGVYCNSNGEANGHYTCEGDEYFDPLETPYCQPFPPVPCTGSCTIGYCPDKTNCQKYYICDGQSATGPITCSPGSYFNAEISPPRCESSASTPSYCPALSVCLGSSSATTTPTTPTTTPTTPTTTPTTPPVPQQQ